ncbi:amino acid adenylation domain-containing protein [Actinoallomurus purpureus]|uniref:MupA/Atu3671 family FMN-dependent luciferase-like monooxygenase n=1 Tax=Actinoallomurus purpureus TaxID=478114 RepID=UPI002091F7D8|nr:MupA/Atu3671 family FMN-dependent luciferase-like monooxygenase [Actinoallomurus purpureus]MCO6008064.1 amino acid adenylation domain-containing protein [Actinoallomurus purpureus]
MTVNREDLLALVAGQLGCPVGELDIDKNFIESGADSLSLLAVARRLQVDFGVRVSVKELFTEIDTPLKLIQMLSGKVSEREPQVMQATTSSQEEPPGVTPSHMPVVASTMPAVASTSSPAYESTSAVSGVSESVISVLNGQLELAEKMISRFSELTSQQLRVLGTLRPDPMPSVEPVRTSPPAAQAASPVSRPQAASDPRPLDSDRTRPPRPATPAASQNRRPEFSLYFFGDYPKQSAAASYEHLLSAATFADQNGFHAVWIPERHFHSFGSLFPNPSVLAASLAGRTSRIRLHAGSVVLPLHNPIRVAEEWSVVDNLSGGRVGISFASGWHSNDFVLAPDNYGRQREVMYEYLDTFRQLWAGDPVRVASGSGEQIDVTLHPAPVQDAPPLFAAVLSNPESYERAARSGLGIVTNLMSQSIEDLRENISLYRRTRAAHGFDPETGRVVVLVHTYLGDDAVRARREAFQPFCDYLRSSLTLFNNVANSLGIDVDLAETEQDDLDFVLERAYERYCESRALIGSVAGSRAVMDALIAAGADEIGCFIDFGVAPDLMLAALPELDALRREYNSRPLEAVGSSSSAEPASPLQRRMWLLDRMYPGGNTYLEPKAILFEGALDTVALHAALQRVVGRHPNLRTVFREGDGVLKQVLLPTIPVECPIVDLTGLDDDAALIKLRDMEHESGFDLRSGPLLRARLGRLGDERHLLYIAAHHIVFDAQSTQIFARDLAAFYRAWPDEPAGLAALGSRPSTPNDQSPERAAESVEFWKRQLADAAPLMLPADRPRQVGPSVNGASFVHNMDVLLSEEIRRFSRAQGCTLFMTLLGAVGSVLGRFSLQEDVTLGTVVNNRPGGSEHVIGMFVETIAIRLDLSGDPGFGELIRRVRARSTHALDYADVPFDQVVEAINPDRVAGENPLFQVMVEFEEQVTLDLDTSGVSAELLDVPRTVTPFDLTLYFADRDSGIRCTAEYDADLFDEATVRRILEYVDDLLRRAVRSPDAPLSRLRALTESDERLQARWQGERTTASPAGLHELVEEQARRTPDAIAITGGGGSVSYRDLDASANRLAHQLVSRGISRGGRVAICLPRGADQVTAILAVLKCGAAYVPVDRSLPIERRRFMMEDSGAGLVIASRSLDTSEEEVLPYSALWIEDIDSGGTTASLGWAVDPEDTAYCIYTSGSTGSPKAVAVPHRGPVNLVRWQLRALGPLDTLQWASTGFDVSVQEIFTTLASGATLVVLDDEIRYEPAAVAEHMRRHNVQRISVPFTPLKYLVDELKKVPSLRQVLIAGEEVTITPGLRSLAEEHPDLTLYNQYGPTEASVVVTSHKIDVATETVPPIGRPIDNVSVRIVDGFGRPVPVGAVGELLIGGSALAHGYLGDPEATSKGFGPDPIGSKERFYHTGDLARWHADGTLGYHGRNDSQVKIRGNRVEPGEVEWALSRLPEVQEAVVLARPDRAGENQLVAYVVLRDGAVGEGDWSPPRAQLASSLPHYLVPQAWVRLDRMPTGPNGKLDRERLRDMDTASPADTGRSALTEMELSVQKLWAAELGNDAIPPERSFFDVGGSSLSAVRLLERIRAELGHKVPMADFLGAPTVRAVAAWLEEREL